MHHATMTSRARFALLSTLLLTSCATAAPSAAQTGGSAPSKTCAVGEPQARTELFFGLARNSGPNITEKEFGEFVDSVVTPLFRDGLTLMGARGQFLSSSGALVRENSRVLILLHDGADAASAKIEEIRRAYKQRFQQESVLRTDARSCVSF